MSVWRGPRLNSGQRSFPGEMILPTKPVLNRRREHFETDHLLDGLRHRTVRGAKHTFSAQLARILLQLASITILARMVGVEEFGLVAMVSALIAVLTPLQGEALAMATIQRDKLDQDQISSMFWINAALGIALTLLLILAAPLVARLYEEPRIVPIAEVLSLTFLLFALSIQNYALLQRQMRFGTVAVIDVASVTAGVGSAIYLAWLGHGLWALIALQLAPLGVRLLLAWIACGWWPTIPRSLAGVGQMLSYGMNMTVGQLLARFHDNLLALALGKLAGATPLGHYNRANALVSLPTAQLVPAFMVVAQPALSRLANEPDRLKRATLGMLQRVLAVTMIFTVVAAACAESLITVFLGESWVAAAPYIQWLSIMIVVQPTTGVLATSLLAAGVPRTVVIGNIANITISLVALAIGSAFGPLGLVAAFALSGTFGRTPAYLWFAERAIGIGLGAFLRVFVPILIMGGAAFAAISGLRLVAPPLPAFFELALYATVGAGVYACVGFAFPGIRKMMLELIGGLLGR